MNESNVCVCFGPPKRKSRVWRLDVTWGMTATTTTTTTATTTTTTSLLGCCCCCYYWLVLVSDSLLSQRYLWWKKLQIKSEDDSHNNITCASNSSRPSKNLSSCTVQGEERFDDGISKWIRWSAEPLVFGDLGLRPRWGGMKRNYTRYSHSIYTVLLFFSLCVCSTETGARKRPDRVV